MKKLVLYSNDQVIDGNYTLDMELLKLIGKSAAKIAYIPSESDPQRKYYLEKKNYYAQYGINDVLYFDLEQEFDAMKVADLLTRDAIHLSGGNTGKFLNSLRKRGFIEVLRYYVKMGGVLTGVSAGSILMSEDIKICSVHPYEYELDEVSDFASLGLTDFDFYPHFDYSEFVINSIREYSRCNSHRIIYACPDGSGIVINNDAVEFVGHMLKFQCGASCEINC
ncbi:MAG: Type 1 glutamine amidotransferase-like domain-containing protein [Negativicutes bacterium]